MGGCSEPEWKLELVRGKIEWLLLMILDLDLWVFGYVIIIIYTIIIMEKLEEEIVK